MDVEYKLWEVKLLTECHRGCHFEEKLNVAVLEVKTATLVTSALQALIQSLKAPRNGRI